MIEILLFLQFFQLIFAQQLLGFLPIFVLMLTFMLMIKSNNAFNR